MGYFFEMTWFWWLIAIVLAVAITWAIFRERKSKGKLDTRESRDARGARDTRGARDAYDARDTRDTRDQRAGGFQDGGFQGDEERARLAADAERTRVDNPGVKIPGQHSSLKERAEELKEKAGARTGRRKFF